MNLIHISEEAHIALLKASPTIRTEGSKPAHGGGYFLHIDAECRDMLDAYGPDYSATIVKVCA